MRLFGAVLFLVCFAATSQAGTITGTVLIAGKGRDAVVYIEKIPGKTFAPPSEAAMLDQMNIRFTPSMIVILAGTKVRFPNSDQVRHNVFSPKPVDGKKLNFGTYPAGDSKEWTFTKPGPVNLLCNIHFEMSAWIVVVETPYYAMVDLQGNYVIKNVPPGNYSLTAWQGDPKVRSRTQQIQVTDTGAVSANFDLRK